MDAYEATHPQFQRSLLASKPRVLRVAQALRAAGFDVEVARTRVAPSRANYRKYSDRGDLYVGGIVPGGRVVIEVKGMERETFTCAADYPYRHLMITKTVAYDRADPKPYAYIIINPELTHVCVVRCDTYDHWWRWVAGDYRPGLPAQEKYMTRIEVGIFLALDDPVS